MKHLGPFGCIQYCSFITTSFGDKTLLTAGDYLVPSAGCKLRRAIKPAGGVFKITGESKKEPFAELAGPSINDCHLTRSQILISFLVFLFFFFFPCIFQYFHPLLFLIITLYSMQLDATS